MPVLIAIATIAGIVIFWMLRARSAARAAGELADAAAEVMNAARRFGFRRKANVHPAESVDQPALALATIGYGFLELDGLPSAEQQRALADSLAARLNLGGKEAGEMLILARWLVNECKGPGPAIDRLAKRLYRIEGAASIEALTGMLHDVAAAGSGELSPKQKAALGDVARILRLR